MQNTHTEAGARARTHAPTDPEKKNEKRCIVHKKERHRAHKTHQTAAVPPVTVAFKITAYFRIYIYYIVQFVSALPIHIPLSIPIPVPLPLAFSRSLANVCNCGCVCVCLASSMLGYFTLHAR